MTKRKTGLSGVEDLDVFFPPAPSAPQEKTQTGKAQKPEPKRRLSKQALASRTKPSPAPKKPSTRTAASTPRHSDKTERRTAWLRADHLDRLEMLKTRERNRLKSENKRPSIMALIDEAIERYLTEME